MSDVARIGITLDLAHNNDKNRYAAKPWYALRQCYSNTVFKAGGVPFMLPYHDNIDAILANIDALVISGGDGDINPSFYGEEISSTAVNVNDERAYFELALVKRALEMDMPILGICNGIQILNVVLGGTLIQHITDELQGGVIHEQPAPKDAPSHMIHIVQDTALSKIANNTSSIMVNSTHHQALKNLGRGLMVAAVADDGIIEAVESLEHKWVIGVQWHCEYLNHELDFALFKNLILAALRYRNDALIIANKTKE